MEKRQLWPHKHAKCYICQPVDSQAECINDQLRSNIRNRLKDEKAKKLGESQEKHQIIEFSHLVKMIYKKKFKSHEITKKCHHENLKRKFIAELQCSQKQINAISNEMSWKIAKYNFHVDTISQQCKTFTRHILQLNNFKKKKQNKIIRSKDLISKKREQNVIERPQQKEKKRKKSDSEDRSWGDSADIEAEGKVENIWGNLEKERTTKSIKQMIQQQKQKEKQVNEQNLNIKKNNQKQKENLTTKIDIPSNIPNEKRDTVLTYQNPLQKEFVYPQYYYNQYPPAYYPNPMYYMHEQYRRMYDPTFLVVQPQMGFGGYKKNQSIYKNIKKEQLQFDQINFNSRMEENENGAKEDFSKNNKSD